MSRRSSSVPVRTSNVGKTGKGKSIEKTIENSQIPKPRLRSLSSDRNSNVRAPMKNSLGKTPQRSSARPSALPMTPSVSRVTMGLPSGSRYTISPGVERASGLGSKVAKKDIRPLHDKAYQTEMITKIEHFFHSTGQAAILNNNGTMRPLTLKMFVDMSSILLDYIGIKNALTSSNYVEELPKLSKKLHYPGVVNKSWLKTANTMHSLQTALGWLSWLVDLANVKEVAKEHLVLEKIPFYGNSEEEIETNRNYFYLMLKCYQAWNCEKFDEEEMYLNEYFKNEKIRLGLTEENMQQVEMNKEEVLKKAKSVEENFKLISDENEKLKETLKLLQDDKMKCKNYIAEEKEHLMRIEANIEKTNQDIHVLRETHEEMKERQKRIQEIIAQQPMSASERDTIVEQCTGIQNCIDRLDEFQKELDKQLYAIDMKLVRINSDLEKAVHAYNNDILKNYNESMGVDLVDLQMPIDNMSNPNIMEVMKEKADRLSKLESDTKKRISEVESEINSLKQSLETASDKLKRFSILRHDSVEQQNEMEIEMKTIKDKAKTEECSLKNEIETLRRQIQDMNKSAPDCESALNELQENEDKLQALQRRKEFLTERANSFFATFYEETAKYKNELYCVLQKCRDI